MESSYYLDTDIDYSKLDPDDPDFDDFDISLVEEGLTKEAKEILKLLEEKLFVIEVIINTGKEEGKRLHDPNYYKDYYVEFYNTMVLQLLHGYEHEEFRTHPVNFKFKEEDINVEHLEFRYFVCNLAFWYPVVTIAPETLCEDHIIRETMGRKMQSSFIAEYMNRTYAIPYASALDSRERSETFADTNYLIMRIPVKFADYIGTSIDIEQFRDMCKRMPEFKEGLYERLDETLQPAEMEEQKKEIDKKQLALIENDDELTTMRIMIASNSTKRKQVAEIVGVIGTKPKEGGTTLPRGINGNWLVDGMRDVIDYYINCISGRNAAVINHEFMGSAGYLLILVALLCVDVKLSEMDDCNTANPIPIFVASEEHLTKLDGRWYRYNQRDVYKCINAKYDNHLIGQRIWVRSPVTCAAPDGICRKCYGELYHTNKTLHSVGCYAAFNQMNPLVQGLLAAKHTQQPNSVKIQFNEEFSKFFVLSATEVILNPSLEDSVEYSLAILVGDIQSTDLVDDDNSKLATKFGKGKKRRKKVSNDDDADILDDEKDLRLNYYVPKFYVVKYLHSKKKGIQEIIEIADVNSTELYMHDDFLERMSRSDDDKLFGASYFHIDLDDIGLEEFIFMVDVQNNEQTAPMKKMKSLIHNQEHGGARTLEDMTQMMLDLTIVSEFDAVSVHGEIIVRQLIRRIDNAMRRPDFSRIIMPGDYTIMSVLTALKQNPAVSVSMSSSYLKYQLVQLLATYDKRDVSDIDYWYKRTLAIDENELWYGVPTDVLERSKHNGGKL